MANLAARITDLAAPLAQAADADLVDVLVKGEGSRRLVKVVVARKGGIDLDACRTIAKDLGHLLDEADVIPDRYQLEVTSPGVDHPLRDRRAFDRVEGIAVLVRRRTGDAVVEVSGTVTTAGDDAVVLDVGGEAVAIPYDQIVTATQKLPW